MVFSSFPIAELQPLHIAFLVSLAVFVLALIVVRTLRENMAVQRRAAVVPLRAGGSSAAQMLRSQEDQRASRLIARAARVVAPNKPEKIAALRKQLIQAGYFSASAVTIFHAWRILLALVLPLSMLTVSTLGPLELPGGLVLIFAACGAALGLILPPIYLDARVRRLREKHRRVFPDFMDLLVVCVESGQSLQSAIDRVSREVAHLSPELAANLYLVTLEFRAGGELTRVFENLFGRLGIEEVKSLAVLLKQSEELGSSIADSLRIYSDEMRDKRLSRAEAKANALPVKMTIPLGLFIFPVILLVILTPAVLRIKDAFL